VARSSGLIVLCGSSDESREPRELVAGPTLLNGVMLVQVSPRIATAGVDSLPREVL
jgi:hypothetical protein